MVGAATAVCAMIAKERKTKKSGGAVSCDCSELDVECDECDDQYCDFERARNDLKGCEDESERDHLDSCGCLGYPHDQYGGFADSKGDRPNDLCCPVLDESDPQAAKNAPRKKFAEDEKAKE